MAIVVVSLDEVREQGRRNGKYAMGDDHNNGGIVSSLLSIAYTAMGDRLTDEAALEAGLNYYSVEKGLTLVSVTATEAIFNKP
ncbi:hypothetical protein ACFFOS_27880 [Nocardioides kongjuensis]|uniref:Uncharacterized protein n=1 Tax=Nocardioides kongjuensis TaxID=349522 RepID=A0A852RDH2_9ACTN|nr:hypothetical protein [Nocardioides kongjuensis]NYD31247.1 hypothetical protein [Nocardioides kongjuensis]